MSKGIPKHGKRDSNEKEIRKGLRALGVYVQNASIPGWPDLWAGWQGVNYLLEVKQPGEKLTPLEAEFFATWPGQAAVVHSLTEAMSVLGIERETNDD